MKKSFLFIILLGTFSILSAQKSESNAFSSKNLEIAHIKYSNSNLVFKENVEVSVENIFNLYKSNFGLGSDDKMVLLKKDSDKLGFSHYKFQQYHKDIPVYDAIFILHERDGKLKSANGKIVQNFDKSSSILISDEDAINAAIATHGARIYFWEDKALEADIKEIKNDPNATYFPTAELFYFAKGNTYNVKDYRLVYKIEILSLEPFKRHYYYIDAQSGEVFHKTNMLLQADKKVMAQTLYNGVREIVMDSISPNQYILRESGRGGGVVTKSLNNNGDMMNPQLNSAVNIVSDNEFFASDPTAANAHWASEMTYDYYFEVHDRNSYDDNGAAMMSYVHWGQNIANAMWTGSAMVYGDGDNQSGPFTTAEICGHEITHAVTQYTANLNYEYESGALNEAFSDMFGVMVNLYATDTLSWLIGENTGSAFRDMSNPKAHNDPNTYGGQYWYNGSSDNGGVHTNSGVGNYWFYLLTSGDNGTNDHGYEYNIEGIGAEKSEQIIYRALSQYLTPSSQFIDAYSAMIQASTDLFGECSDETKSVAGAWAAVGVGYPYDENAIFIPNISSPYTACGLEEEIVELSVMYNGCGLTLNSGTEINFKILVNQQTEYYDTIFTTADIFGGELMNLSLNKYIDLSNIGNNRIDIWAKPATKEHYTDSIKNYRVINNLQQNFDFGAISVLSPLSSCHLGEEELISMDFGFYGCDSIEAGSTVRLGYMNNQNDTIFENHILENTLFPGDILTYTFVTPCDFTQAPQNTLKVFTANDDDSFLSNNNSSTTIQRPIFVNDHGPFTFSESHINDYYYKTINKYAKLRVRPLSGYEGFKVLNFSGGNVFDYYEELNIPFPGQEWEYNETLSAMASFCVDARDLEALHMGFDLKQTSGSPLYAQLLGPGDYTSSSIMRILVNGTHHNSQTLKCNTPTNDPFKNHIIDLSNYVGDILEVSFETRNIAGDTLMFTLDNAYLDNLHFILNSADNIDENNPLSSIYLYPNPGNGKTTLFLPEDISGNALINIFDLTGRLIYSEAFVKESNQHTNTIDLSNFNSGTYILSLEMGQFSQKKKLIIQQ